MSAIGQNQDQHLILVVSEQGDRLFPALAVSVQPEWVDPLIPPD